MEFETLKKSHKKEIIFGVIIFILIAIVLIVHQSFAKYQAIKNMTILEGTINYKIPDFKIMAMYKNDGDGDIEITEMPESGYIINESKSYCNLNESKDNNARIYTDENGQHIISKLSKGDKCYIFFDKKLTAGETILTNVSVNEETPNFSNTSCSSGCGEVTVGVFKTQDDDGDTYYFRGDVTNNYIKFADKYWRIVRINGDGTIRVIYNGSNAYENGLKNTDSIIASSQCFNTNCNYENNMYVGFKYTSGEVHGIGTKSNALTQLETWYSDNLASYANKLDTNAGFCGDRSSYIISNDKYILGGGTGTTNTYYGAYVRLVRDNLPILNCSNEDLYTVAKSSKGNKSLQYPIGLITADEPVYI